MVLSRSKRVGVHIVVLIGCACAWFGMWLYLVPPGFGMPEYEEELELTFMVSTVVVLVGSLFVGSWVSRLLGRDPAHGQQGPSDEGS